MHKDSCKNRLADETSPYLLQHANNPVDWYPWGEEAIEKARQEKKPILLSIGYSACHWCHVMAHESFEDADTASIMNQHFVNVKVDREERPDLDKIYQAAHQLLAQRTGGWPLTMFLMPNDHVPFFGGTYFPPEPRHSMPSFKELMAHIHDYYKKQMADLAEQNKSVMAALQRLEEKTASASRLTAVPLDIARQQLAKNFDREHGGFGLAPKFPHPTNLERLLRHCAAKETNGEQDEEAFGMLSKTLHAMAFGGIYDQLGGGFCRYSVDERWEIPHFEKMLYDNGPLLSLYAQAYKASDNAVFKRIAKQTGEWVLREMQSSGGGFYSTLDADSEGEEGKFFAWSRQEVKESLANEIEFNVVEKYFGLDAIANFEGKWHFNVKENTRDITRNVGIGDSNIDAILFSAKEKLFNAREKRIKPGRDEKILTSWNGLMIKGLAETGHLLGEEKFIDSAQRAVDFIKAKLWVDGRLLATYKDGKAHLNAYLDDYVFLVDGIIELLQARWRKDDLDFAIKLLDVVLVQFEDKEKGGFFFTANDHEKLIMRPKPFSDDALPSGNGVAASVLLRLGHLLGEHRYIDAAERTLKIAWNDISQMPYIHNALLLALEQFLFPQQTIVLRGDKALLVDWIELCNDNYILNRFLVAIPDDETDLPGILAANKPQQQAVAYVCERFECKSPITTKKDFLLLLKNNIAE
jgi:uncharacterized protein YyaL (SSP411 family)